MWRVPEHLPLHAFRKWIPRTAPPPYSDAGDEEHPLEWLRHEPRIRFAITWCYRCNAESSFYFGEAYSGGAVFIADCIGLYSQPVVDLITSRGTGLTIPAANLKIAFSSTVGAAYVMQCCLACGAHFGHFPLWEEIAEFYNEGAAMPTLYIPNPPEVLANPGDVEHIWAES